MKRKANQLLIYILATCTLAVAQNLDSRSPNLSWRRQATSDNSSIYQTRFPNVTWDNDNWELTTTLLDQGHYQSRISLANGYIGINLAALGPFFDVDVPVDGDNIAGWPLFDRRQSFATIGGFYDVQPKTNGTNFPWLDQYGWESVISGIPHWAGIVVDLGNGIALRADSQSSNIHNFTSTLEMQRAVMNWAFTWSPPNHGSFDVSYQMFLHKVDINQAYVSMNITARNDTKATIVNVLNGDCAVRTNATDKGTDGDFLYSAVNPWNIHNVTAFVYTNMSISGASNQSDVADNWTASYVGKNGSSIAGAVDVTLPAGQTVSIVKYVGIASSDGFAQPNQTAKNAAMAAMKRGYADALDSHTSEWRALFPASSVDDYSYPENSTLPNDDYVIEAQIMAVVNPFHLLQNTVSKNATDAYPNATIDDNSISVGGLGSDAYAGWIFWDAELWMQPGLVAAFPYAAKQIANYRVAKYPEAKNNINTAYTSSKNDTYFSPDGAIFPWTSGRYGNCTAAGPCWDYEYHINGDIGLDHTNYWFASGDTEFFQEKLNPIYQSVATMFSDILQRNGSLWALTNMTDPDEFANNKDNGGYTMPLIGNHLMNANDFAGYFNGSTNNTWTTQGNNVQIGRNENAGIILEYTGMNGSLQIKQADVVLVTFPLSYNKENYTEQDSLSDLNYYASKQSQGGPALTYSIFSIIANEVYPSGCGSYTFQQYSTEPYVRAPWFQFSEQLLDSFATNGGFHPAFPFLTGHGGANQVVLFGYLGLRYIPGWVLHIDPSLPPQIPQLRYRTFYWYGWAITAYSNSTHTTLSRERSDTPAAPGVVRNTTFENAPIPVQVGPINGYQISYSLKPNASLVVPNRMSGFNKTVANNVAQCQPVSSDADVVPGQFALSAVDGASSTKWQPMYANQTSQLTVELPLGHRVVGFTFDWAQAPPYNYSIFFHNDSSSSTDFGTATAVTVVESLNVTISSPYDAKTADEIVPVTGNTSSLFLNASRVGGQDLPQDLYTSRYATLGIWGSQYNNTFTRQNQSGPGATVAEWTIIVEDDGSSSYGQGGTGGVKALRPRGVSGSGASHLLGRLDRYLNTEDRRRGMH